MNLVGVSLFSSWGGLCEWALSLYQLNLYRNGQKKKGEGNREKAWKGDKNGQEKSTHFWKVKVNRWWGTWVAQWVG